MEMKWVRERLRVYRYIHEWRRTAATLLTDDDEW
jgi:hypothetical protein